LIDISKGCQLDFRLLKGFACITVPVEGRPRLPVQLSTHFFLRILLTGTLLFLAGLVYAQPVPRGEAVFMGVKKSDRVGPASAIPDGKPDAVFSLTLKPRPAEPVISEIQIRAFSGSPGFWSSTGQTSGAGYIGVARAKNPSEIINRQVGPLNVNPQADKHLLLFVTDDGTFSQKDRRYQIKVIANDGSSWTGPVKSEAGPAPETPSVESGAAPVRMSAVLKGISNFDAVSPGKTIAGDDKPDGLFLLTVEAKDREISAIEIRNADGTPSVWDTVPSTKNGPIGVALESDPVRLVNNRDGTVSIKIKDRVDLNLYVADNGSIAEGKTNYWVSVAFSGGGVSRCPAQRIAQTAEEKKDEPAATSAKVNFLATWLGFVSTDAVGPYSGMKPDGVADALFGLDIEVSPKNFITGIEINSLLGGSTKWGTTGTGQANWGLAVAYQSAPTALLNNADGAVKIPVDKRSQFYVYASDPGDLATTYDRLRMVVHLADGTSYQQPVRAPLATTSTVVPGTDEATRAKGLITCEFRGFIADLVNTSTRPGKDGYLDGTFIMKLQVEDKKLVKVEVKSSDGASRWSSEPKAPAMLLGVALYPKIYKLINEKPGMLQLPVSGRRTFYLYAADNGLLSDPKSRLIVTATFSDKTTLSTDVIK
jgi:hypothetical protein